MSSRLRYDSVVRREAAAERLIFACAVVLIVSSGANAEPLNPGLNAIEGNWAEDCVEAQDVGFAIRYSFEFLRSGGSIRFDDGVDIWWRGTVTAIQPLGKGFVFTYSENRSAQPKRLRAKMLPDGRLEVGESDRSPSSVFLSRCAGPDHRVVGKLRWRQISALTPSRSRFVYFVNPGKAGCRDAEDYLHFDLIGPVDFSVWHYGKNSNTLWKVERANDDNETVQLRLSGESNRATISVAFPDSRHIRVEPWHETFLRCEE